MFNDVKDKIYEFFKAEMAYNFPDVFPLDETGFSEKIYWEKTRDTSPSKPYIVLKTIMRSKINKAHEVYKIDGKPYQRENWRMVVTFSVYNNTVDGERTASDYIEFIELLFNKQTTFEALQKNDIIVNEKEISDIRDLSDYGETNYNYRYEIDVTFEFDKIIEPDVYGDGEKVYIEMDIKDSDKKVIIGD